MRPNGSIVLILASLLLATAADANPKGNKEHGNGNGNGHSEGAKCPPGLAKKNPPCVPPGLAHRTDDDQTGDLYYLHPYAVGQSLPAAYVPLFDPLLYPFWQKAAYVRYGDFFYLIDPLTGAILQNSGPVEDWRWGWSDVDFAHCPPGLAKKNPPCVPPGQARKMIHPDPYKPGDLLPTGYRVILTPPSQQGPDNAVYARLGDSLYRVDRQTGQVLALIGLMSDLLR